MKVDTNVCSCGRKIRSKDRSQCTKCAPIERTRTCRCGKVFTSKKRARHCGKCRSRKDRKVKTCLECKKSFKETTLICCKCRYRKDPKWYLQGTFGRMRNRIKGINAVSKRYPHLYQGKELCKCSEFVEWAITDPMFQRLYRNWQLNGFKQTLAPSIDRIDSCLGYTFGNMRWIVTIENSKDGNRNRWKLHPPKDKQAIIRAAKNLYGEEKVESVINGKKSA